MPAQTAAVDWGLVIGLGSFGMTLLLGALAIALSVYFYTQAKNTEGNVQAALAAIQKQTTSLERLN